MTQIYVFRILFTSVCTCVNIADWAAYFIADDQSVSSDPTCVQVECEEDDVDLSDVLNLGCNLGLHDAEGQRALQVHNF